MDVKRNGVFCYGRKLWTPSFLQSNGHLKRQFLSSDFLDQQAPRVCVLKHHVGCHTYQNFWRRCATWEASINRESTHTRICGRVGGGEGWAGVYIENESGSQKKNHW